MKKMILCAVALMLGAITYAQTSQTTAGTTSATSAKTAVGANGNAPATANTGESRQEGDNQRVQARQQGENNSIETFQANGSGTGGNQSTALQLSTLDGFTSRRNVIYTEQIGSDNRAFALQVGDDNDAVIEQGLNDDASHGNSAYIRQIDPDENEEDRNNFAGIQQDGGNNSAFTDQNVSNNDANTIQAGNENLSEILQDSETQPSDIQNGEGHDALVEQVGNANQSSLNQVGYNRNTARAAQFGNGNSAEQVQNSLASPGVGNTARVAQGITGDSTDNFLSDPSSDLNALDADVEFSAPSGFVVEPTEDNIAYQNQLGSGNNAEIAQFGIGNNASQVQEGGNNNADVIQGFDANVSEQAQWGWDNNAEAGQLGSHNKNYQVQDGVGNNSLVSQFGDENVSNTYQYGYFNDARVAQQGVHNAALIVQTDGQSYAVQQNLNSTGGNNQVDAQQTTAYGSFVNPADVFYKPTGVPGLNLEPHTIPGIDPLHVAPNN